MGKSSFAVKKNETKREIMKLQASMILLGCDAMKHMDGKLDQFAIHIGGGAFDAGTSETLAKWAIRKCEKKVCSVWPWAQCPLHTTKFDKDKKLTQAPCCHKCWNKCPPVRIKLQLRSPLTRLVLVLGPSQAQRSLRLCQ